ncbi:MAG TPA: SPOR domain-containing protein, partial [Longimicrobiaceae bacterium]|nr:SPOR domain-containing protein [Longimicrobiaceae bacterium]
PKLLAGFRDAHASLLLFVPVDAPGLTALAQWSAQAVLLGEQWSGSEAPPPLPEDLAVLATLTPPARDGASTETASVAPAFVDEPDFREPGETALLPDESAPQEAPVEPEVREERDPVSAGGVAEPTMVIAAPDVRERERVPQSPAAAVAAEERSARRYRRTWTIALWVVLATLGLAAAGYLTVLYRPDLFGGVTNRGAGAGNVELASAGTGISAPPSPPATRAGTELAYAVQLMAFRSHGAAREQVAAEERRLGDQPVYISPELIQGILYYRVLAGMPADSAAALRLRQRLLDAGAIDAEDAAGALDLIQYAPLTFQLGEFSTRRAALARADSLVQLGIPSYPAAVPYSDGSERWRLYGGAFRDSLHAEGMRELLSQAGLEPPLVARRGKPTINTP